MLRRSIACTLFLFSVLKQQQTMAINQFGTLLHFLQTCNNDYFSLPNCPQTYPDFNLIHPVKSLSCLKANANQLSTPCKTDVLQHSLYACSTRANQTCQNLIDPGVTWDVVGEEYQWPVEMAPFQAAVDCLLSSGNYGDALDECASWISQAPVKVCYQEAIRLDCNDPNAGSALECLLSKQANINDNSCKDTMSQFPTSFSSLNVVEKLKWQEYFYNLIPIPYVATPTPQPSVSPTPTQDTNNNGNLDSGNYRKSMSMAGAGVLIVVICVLVIAGAFWARKRSKANQPFCPCVKKNYTIDEPDARQDVEVSAVQQR